MRYVIIGNGIIALSTVSRLVHHLHKNDTVHVIGPEHRTGSATLAAAAMQNSFAEIGPSSLEGEPQKLWFELSRQATSAWPEFIASFMRGDGRDSDAMMANGYGRGTYVINNTAADDLDDRNFDAIASALKQYNEPHALVDPKEIPNYAPAQRQRATRAIYIENEGWLNPRLVLGNLQRALQNHPQVHWHDAEVQSLEHRSGKITGARLQDSRVEGDQFLLAPGASFSKLLDNSGLALPIQRVFYGVGVSLVLQCPESPHRNCVRTPNRGGACGVYTAPMFDGQSYNSDHILIGASNMLSPEPIYHGRIVSIEHLMRSAVDEINAKFYSAQLIKINVGWRPTTLDTFPLLGKTSLANLFVACGTKRDGFHVSPIVSEIMAAWLTGKQPDPRLTVFDPERAPIRSMTREAAIKTIVESLMSEQFQHGYTPSNIRMNEQVRASYQRDIEALHDRVGALDWGIHPELVNMYRLGHAK
jgi:glycine oxidase